MKNFVPVKHYERVNSISMNGLVYETPNESTKFYMGFNDSNDIIIENVNDKGVYYYDRVKSLIEMGGKVLPFMDLIGISNSNIFDKNYKDIDEFGFCCIENNYQ